MKSSLKILLLGDASAYHHTLGLGLARLGHDVTVASNGSGWLDTKRNIDISRKFPGKLGGALLWARLSTVLSSRLKGYDVVQIVSPIFVDLRPNRVGALFQRLKRDNGGVWLTALGTDTAYLDMALSDNCPLGFTEFMVDGTPTEFARTERADYLLGWVRNQDLRNHTEMIYENVKGVASALYEYHLAMERVVEPERLVYAGIPVDLDRIDNFSGRTSDSQKRDSYKVLVAYHPGRDIEKGIPQILSLTGDIPGIETEIVSGLPYAQFIEKLRSADAVVDQYYSHSPATTALNAMAMGKAVVTGASPQFAKFIGESVPAINVSPHDHETVVRLLGERWRPGSAAREYVERNHETTFVAKRFLNLWERTL